MSTPSASLAGELLSVCAAVHDAPSRLKALQAQQGDLESLRAAAQRNRMRRVALQRAQAHQQRQVDSARDAIKSQGDQLTDAPLPRLRAFLRARHEACAEAATAVAWFRYGAQLCESDLRDGPAQGLFDAASAWPLLEERLAPATAKLKAESAYFKSVGCAAETQELEDMTAEAKQLYARHAAAWLRENQRRSSYDKMLQTFTTDREKLTQWCRQQTATLNSLTEPEHIQEFCASFRSNTGVMEANFLVLLETSESLLPNPDVEKLLVELADVWIGVEVFAFEKLRQVLMEQHAKSGLEGYARDWPQFATRFAKFLGEADSLLQIPTDDESVQVAQPVKTACAALQNDHSAHLLIAEHLADFSMREEFLKPHYSSIRKAITSKLTLLTQAFPGSSAYPRKQEYTDRMSELNDWIESKSQGGAWRDLLVRVDKMRKLIEDTELSKCEE